VVFSPFYGILYLYNVMNIQNVSHLSTSFSDKKIALSSYAT
jgi:hypothetical protein